MNHRSCYNREPQSPASSTRGRLVFGVFLSFFIVVFAAQAFGGSAEAPAWMHALVNAPLPPHDEKTDAVLLYSEENLSVLSTEKVRRSVRRVYRILRPGGRKFGTVSLTSDSLSKVIGLRGWCIPAEGKDYEVKDKETVESAFPIDGGSLYPDLKYKLLRIPAPDPGNIVGYEYETEEDPVVLQDGWRFQTSIPVAESRYTLQLPPGWEYRVSWRNYSAVQPTSAGGNSWQWVVREVPELRPEEDMPPFDGLAGQVLVSFIPAAGPSAKGFASWREMGKWYVGLLNGRLDASAPIKQKTAELVASAPDTIEKMRALAQFVQRDFRYVAIELGIGGWQPYPASQVFSNRYGDCKDKTTVLRSMLQDIGIESYHVTINTERGSVSPDTAAHLGFNHVITAIRLPDGVNDPSLVAVIQHPSKGRLLFFDPTDELTPFGQIRGALQANYGLIVFPDGGELIQLPTQPSSLNGIHRAGKLTLDANGWLRGDVQEVRVGDRARSQRWALRSVTSESEKIKPIESLLSQSFPLFRITKATATNVQHTDQPFGFNYSFEVESYARQAGDMLLVRPRVLGSKTDAILETREPRKFAIEFDGPVKDVDSFEIAIPAGYVVDDMPAPVDVEYSFGTYHSKTEVSNGSIHYTRTFEIRELSVPVTKADELKKFYRIIAGDERSSVVLRAGSR